MMRPRGLDAPYHLDITKSSAHPHPPCSEPQPSLTMSPLLDINIARGPMRWFPVKRHSRRLGPAKAAMMKERLKPIGNEAS